MKVIEIIGKALTIEEVNDVAREKAMVKSLDPETKARMTATQQWLNNEIQKKEINNYV